MTDSNAQRWPCESCGAELRYVPGQSSLVCEYCGHRQQIPEAGDRVSAAAWHEYSLAQGLADDLPDSARIQAPSTRCTNCGALIEFDGASHATECPFCASVVVADTGQGRRIKPQALIPFILSESEARQAMVNWLGRLWFAPPKLVSYARHGRKMNGVYVPHWTFDAVTRSRYSGKRGDVYYVTVTVTVNVNGRPQEQTRQEPRIRWTPVSGQVARDFDDVLVLGSSSLPRAMAEHLQPWDMRELVPYSADYLAGFNAEGYTIPLGDASKDSKEKMAQVIEGDIRADIGGDQQQISAVSTSYSAETFKHILLPIWAAAYKYNGKSYRFLVNGQTGEVQGERPYSIWKIVLAALTVIILAVGAYYLAEANGFRFD